MVSNFFEIFLLRFRPKLCRLRNMPTHAFFILSLSLLLPPAFAENVPSNIGDARKALKESEVRLDLVVASWQQASDQLQKMANCEYNDTKDQDIKEIQDNNKTLQKALSRLKASLRKIENDGKAIFESPSNVTACDGAPKDLGEKTLKFQQLINSEFDLNFPSNRQHEVDQVARNARPNLQRALQKYRGWNCNSSKGALDMIGAEACRRYKVCSRGVDPAAIYQNVLTHLDKGKQAWISSAEQRELSVKETLKGLREVASKESSRLFELASSCQSAGDLAAGDLKKEDTASPPPAPAPVAPVKEGSERAPATIAQTPRLDPPHPAPAEAKNLAPTVSSPIAGVTGAILRAEQANPTREPDSPKTVVPENKDPPPVAAAPAPKTVAAVNSDNSPWAAPNWKIGRAHV